jgi:hypothetical protein
MFFGFDYLHFCTPTCKRKVGRTVARSSRWGVHLGILVDTEIILRYVRKFDKVWKEGPEDINLIWYGK